MRRVTLAVVLALAALEALAGPCPERMRNRLPGWPLEQTVTYGYADGVPSMLRAAGAEAFASWNEANARNRTNIRFVPTSGSPMLEVNVGPLSGTVNDEFFTAAWFQARERDFTNGRLRRAAITVDLSKFDLTQTGTYFDALRKVLAHEVGHTMGLGHPEDPEPRGSIMNGMAEINDAGNNMPLSPTDCDEELAAIYNDLWIVGGGPPVQPRRPKPPNMPDYLCDACRVTTYPEPGARPRRADAYCCGANNGNGPRSPNVPPSIAFSRTGYECRLDGWIDVACNADLCCVHPDDLFPPGVTPTPIGIGTTCAAQGWYEHDQAEACRNSVSPPSPCVKKEVCGAGRCRPWPNYCWRQPHAPGPTPNPDPPDPTVGVTCQSKGWYNGDNYDSCVRDHGSCERKQDCDGQQCLPAPFYCWRPS